METPSVLLAHGPTTPPQATPVASRADVLLPWILGVATTIPFALIVDGVERWFALGLGIGLAIGAALSSHLVRRVKRQAEAAIAQWRADMLADADGRVAMVIRQFQWAVDDVTTLRQQLTKTKDVAGAAEHRARRAEQQIRLLELELYRARGKAVPRAGEPALAARDPNAHPSEAVVVTTAGDLVRL